MITPTTAAPPPMIVIIPESRLEELPAVVYADIQPLEKSYYRGNYYITVPAELYTVWPTIRLEGVPTP